MRQANKHSFRWTRLTHFEFWPFWVFYFPTYFYGLWLALKSRSFMYFSTVNPLMEYGGVMGVSKYKILSALPEKMLPKTIFIPANTHSAELLRNAQAAGIEMPFVIKPDVGERGTGVEIIRDSRELEVYLKHAGEDLIVQELVEAPLELGVMYHRMPGEEKGHITSVVQKGFLSVTGDGVHTLRALVGGNLRAAGRLEYLTEKFAGEIDLVLPAGVQKNLEPIGNHCRGTTFHNANHLINADLHRVFDTIAMEIEGFYYGRFDLKVPSVEDLYAGRNIKILELNGVSSEVAHIYDPQYKLLRAYRDVFQHMGYIYRIAKANHAAGVPRAPLGKFLQDLVRHLREK